MGRYRATYVLSSGSNPCGEADATDFSTSDPFVTVDDVDGVTIWRVAGS